MTAPTPSNSQTRPHVVILGAGFGGLNAAKALRNAPVRVTIIDRRNHHLFQPLLYQVATAGLNASDIASPVRRILRKQQNVEVLLAEAVSIDLANKQVELDIGPLPFDYLIVATGATHSYFGHPEWTELAPGLKTIEDAIGIRRRVLLAFEMAERADEESDRDTWTNFVIVGAGPTGVELAGSLAEISRKTLASDFRRIDPTVARIILVEAGPRILPSYHPSLSEAAQRSLQKIGVEVHTSTAVTGIDELGVDVANGRFEARTVLWAAGVAASPLARMLGAPLDRSGRAQVTPQLTVPGHDYAYVVGDLAAVKRGEGWIPGVAQGAIQGGQYAAKRIRKQLAGQDVQPFVYNDKGSLATIGRAKAIADFGNLRFDGLLAWLLWLVVHVMFLVGFRNRVSVLLEWVWTYLSFERGARLITGSTQLASPTPRLSRAAPANPERQVAGRARAP